MKTSLSEKLRLGLPRNDPFLRALNIVALIVLIGFCLGKAVGAELAKPDPIVELVGEGQTDYESYNKVVRAFTKSQKDLDEAKQQATALQGQNQYLAVLAERNEMAVRLLQANATVTELQKQLDAATAKIATLEAEKTKWDEALKKSVEAGLLKK